MSSKIDYNALSLVARSKYRQLAVEELAEGPSTPSEIVEKRDTKFAPVSKALGRLRDEGVVELLVAEETKKGRYYGLTPEGKEIVEALGETK